MGRFSAIKDARGSRSLYFQPGRYRVKIERCKYGKTRKGVDMFVAETVVIESDSDTLVPGTTPSFLVTFDKDPALGNVADFMRVGLAALAAGEGQMLVPDTIELDESIAEEIAGEENILAGIELGLYAYNKPTKAGNPFTRLEWNVPKDVLASAQQAQSA